MMNNKINKVKRGDIGYLPSSKSFNELPKGITEELLKDKEEYIKLNKK
mgnify:FL=1